MDRNNSLTGEIAELVKSIGKIKGQVHFDKDIYAELGVESVYSIELLLALEDSYGIAIDDTQFVKARTVQALTRLVLETRAA